MNQLAEDKGCMIQSHCIHCGRPLTVTRPAVEMLLGGELCYECLGEFIMWVNPIKMRFVKPGTNDLDVNRVRAEYDKKFGARKLGAGK